MALSIRVEIEGEADDGKPAEKSAEVIALSQHGMLLKARSNLKKGSTVHVFDPQNNQRGSYRVVWTAPVPLEGVWNVGAEHQSGDPIVHSSSS